MITKKGYDIGIHVGVLRGKATDTECCALIIGLSRSGLPKGNARDLDKALDDTLSKIARGVDAGPEPGITHLMFAKHLPVKPERIILTGVGKSGGRSNIDEVRVGFAAVAHLAETSGLKYLVGVLPQGASMDYARAMAEGFLLGAYHYDKFKEKKRNGAISFTVLVENARDMKNAAKAVEQARVIAESVWMVRDLANAPGNEKTPKDLARYARMVAKNHGLSCKVLDKREIAKNGMNGLLAVNRGSAEEPVFIEMEYVGKGSGGKKAKPIVLVGKAITFDTGGISLKPTTDMDLMKYDMSGGAAVLGVMSAAARLKLPIHLIGLIPSSENMPGSKAYKPGDIIKYKNGRTVEIISTDAEGRLILADGLIKADGLNPKYVVDIATLTGGAKWTFGRQCAAVLGNDNRLINALKRAGQGTHERLWQLPLWPDIAESMRGDTADLKNSGGRMASTITASYFLSKFVSYPWAHLDIAGMAWSTRNKGYLQKGSTGFGTRLLIQWLSGLKGK